MTDTIRLARAFATRAHAGQHRKGRQAEPYITHPEEVAALVTEFGGGVTAICAGWLHDTVEDCPYVTHADLETLFGVEIAAVVAELSDDKSLARAERKRRQIAAAPDRSPSAALVGLADKLSNVRSLVRDAPAGWDTARKAGYLDWADAVVARLPHLPPTARARFAETLAVARKAL